MKIHFYKYQATGNDFVVIDNLSGQYSFSKEQIEKICHRKFGIGADGLILIEKHPDLDFNLVYYNSDGSQSLCGNGSRAAILMAAAMGLVNGNAKFNAYDGVHEAEILPNEIVKLKINDVSVIKPIGEDIFIHTGSPHYVKFISAIEEYPVYIAGKKIREDESFKPDGTNVNFVEVLADNSLFVRTFERGVENETLSCGTGVTAAAIASTFKGFISPVKVATLGGQLTVQFKHEKNGSAPVSTGQAGLPDVESGIFTDIYLIGPAKLVFQGDLDL